MAPRRRWRSTLFDRYAGTDQLRKLIDGGATPEAVVASFASDEQAWRRARAPSNSSSSINFSIWRGSHSYSNPSSHHLMMRFKHVASRSSLGPGPNRPPFLNSYKASKLDSYQSS